METQTTFMAGYRWSYLIGRMSLYCKDPQGARSERCVACHLPPAVWTKAQFDIAGAATGIYGVRDGDIGEQAELRIAYVPSLKALNSEPVTHLGPSGSA